MISANRLVLAKLLFLAFGVSSLGLFFALGVIFFLLPQLPDVQQLRDFQLQVPMTVHAADGSLIGEFGEKKRTPVSIEDVPLQLKNAITAAEDNRFYKHPGVDWVGLTRAFIELLRTGEKRQGGSTITMQVARNFFLTREKTYLRKLTEILLAIQIERELDKEQVLELYINKIFLGQRAYGFAAAAQVYYGKELEQLSLAELAMLAGLPKAPSLYNPVRDPVQAKARRSYVLSRMVADGHISQEEFRLADSSPVTASLHRRQIEVDSGYAAEMARNWAFERFGKEAYTRGYRVETSIDMRLQGAANRALRAHLLAYEKRHDYRGPEKRFGPETDLSSALESLVTVPEIGGLVPAVVTAVQPETLELVLPDGGAVFLDSTELAWSGAYWEKQGAGEYFDVGDLLRLQRSETGNWLLAQLPEVEGALVALDASSGQIVAIAGGFDFKKSHFNRVVQAQRQPGSNFKPFLYTAALAHGFGPASVINDAPLVFEDDTRQGGWRPKNYSGRFFGPTRLRVALMKSRNLVSVRLLDAIGIERARDYFLRFGFDKENLPADLSLALGSGVMTPLELVSGYAVLANGGYRVQSYLVTRVTDQWGEVVWQADFPKAAHPAGVGNSPLEQQHPQEFNLGSEEPPLDNMVEPALDTAGLDFRQVLDGRASLAESSREENSGLAPKVLPDAELYLINSMLRDVIRSGTGRKALRLGRGDLAGKTGTTNSQQDAWFSGFAGGVVTTAWVGFDRPRSLGRFETGARAALPIWIDFMQEALVNRREWPLVQPPDIVSARIDPKTGRLAGAQAEDAIFEFFTRVQLEALQSQSEMSLERDLQVERAVLF